MSKKNRAIVKGVGEICPKCGQSMERRMHPSIPIPSEGRDHYFSEWDYCSCGHLQHYEKFKIKFQ